MNKSPDKKGIVIVKIGINRIAYSMKYEYDTGKYKSVRKARKAIIRKLRDFSSYYHRVNLFIECVNKGEYKGRIRLFQKMDLRIKI